MQIQSNRSGKLDERVQYAQSGQGIQFMLKVKNQNLNCGLTTSTSITVHVLVHCPHPWIVDGTDFWSLIFTVNSFNVDSTFRNRHSLDNVRAQEAELHALDAPVVDVGVSKSLSRSSH